MAASISKSYLWRECTIFRLLQNMRIEQDVPPVTVDGQLVHFKDWVLSLSDGLAPTYALDDDVEPSWVEIPKEVQQPTNISITDTNIFTLWKFRKLY